MNWRRIILGGLAAGVIINVSEVVLHQGVLNELSGGQVAMKNIKGFLIGITLVWLYAAIRPRYGAGLKTAICAGAAVWFLVYFLSIIGDVWMWPLQAQLAVVGWGLVEMIVAGLAGGWIYREQGQTAS